MTFITTESIPILGDIETMMASITPAAILRAESKLEQMEEGHHKALGVIHREEIKRLYVAGKKFHSKAKRLKAQAEDADTEEEGAILKAESDKCFTLSGICQHLCVVQLQDDFNKHNEDGVGVASGWMAVTCECRDSDGPPPEIVKILGGLIRPRR